MNNEKVRSWKPQTRNSEFKSKKSRPIFLFYYSFQDVLHKQSRLAFQKHGKRGQCVLCFSEGNVAIEIDGYLVGCDESLRSIGVGDIIT